jgi:DUF4097 and DUF4098 domain-containing protein YvlB
MNDLRETFDVGEDPRIEVSIRSGDVRIKQGDVGKIEVRVSGSENAVADVEIDVFGDTVIVKEQSGSRRWSRSSISLIINIPTEADVAIRVGAGDVRIDTRVHDLNINVGSGDVRCGDVVGATHVNVASGDLSMGVLTGGAEINSASGDVRVEAAGDLKVGSAAGDIVVGGLSGSGRVKSASGDAHIRRFSGSDLSVSSMSGDTSIGLIPGMAVDADIKTLSGSLVNRITPSEGERRGTMRLSVKSLSGDVILKSAKDH